MFLSPSLTHKLMLSRFSVFLLFFLCGISFVNSFLKLLGKTIPVTVHTSSGATTIWAISFFLFWRNLDFQSQDPGPVVDHPMKVRRIANGFLSPGLQFLWALFGLLFFLYYGMVFLVRLLPFFLSLWQNATTSCLLNLKICGLSGEAKLEPMCTL